MRRRQKTLQMFNVNAEVPFRINDCLSEGRQMLLLTSTAEPYWES